MKLSDVDKVMEKLPIIQCENGKYKVGKNGVCDKKTREMAEAARAHVRAELVRIAKEENAERKRKPV